MSKLPYTYTVLPPQEAPKQITASCTEMGKLLSNSINGDLTINNRGTLWESWSNAPLQPEPFEDRLSKLSKEKNT